MEKTSHELLCFPIWSFPETAMGLLGAYSTNALVRDIRAVRQFNPTLPVATAAARAKTTGHVDTSTRPDPERSDAVEIATRRCPPYRSRCIPMSWDCSSEAHLEPQFRLGGAIDSNSE